jgi:hypothetical protein
MLMTAPFFDRLGEANFAPVRCSAMSQQDRPEPALQQNVLLRASYFSVSEDENDARCGSTVGWAKER